MASTKFYLDEVGEITIVKRKGTKRLSLRVDPEGRVKLNIPKWAPYKVGLQFAKTKKDWILSQQQKSVFSLEDKMLIGKNIVTTIHRGDSSRIRATHKDRELDIYLPKSAALSDKTVENKVKNYIEKSLRTQSEELLIPRAREMAKTYGYSPESITVSKLRSRWGSCSHKRDIKLSLYLVQMPWEVIDYVIAHELAHTKHLNHSREFWNEVELIYDDYKIHKKSLKNFQPRLYNQINLDKHKHTAPSVA